MLDVYRVEIGASQRAGLRAGRGHKFMRGHRDRRHAEIFKFHRVVQTARRTRPSIGQGLDHRSAFGLHQLIDHRVGRGLGERRLHYADNLLDAVTGF